jgi:hypothetical protein
MGRLWRRNQMVRSTLVSTAILASASARAAAQEPARTDVLSGVVRDESSGRPIPNARVRIETMRKGVLTDENGRFHVTDVPTGELDLSVEQYGYVGVDVVMAKLEGEPAELEVPLTPRPVMLDGVTVVADRLQLMQERLVSRRRAVAVASRAYGSERLFESPARDLLEFLGTEAMLNNVPCDGRLGGWCVFRRGRAVQPRVYIDEIPLLGGFDQLATYQPHELYMLEIYSQGQEIRAYTHQFMERMARRPVALIPIGIGLR